MQTAVLGCGILKPKSFGDQWDLARLRNFWDKMAGKKSQ